MPRDATPKVRARQLRRDQTPVEQALWFALRAKRFDGVKFTRQTPVGPYVLDFAARSFRLAIEIDGDIHATRTDYDARRTAFLEQQGYRVIRFTNHDVMTNPEGVLHAIGLALAERASPLPTLSPKGRGLSPS